MLSQPQDSMELQHKQAKSVAATCFSFLSGDANNFIVGSEECMAYSASRHGRCGLECCTFGEGWVRFLFFSLFCFSLLCVCVYMCVCISFFFPFESQSQ